MFSKQSWQERGTCISGHVTFAVYLYIQVSVISTHSSTLHFVTFIVCCVSVELCTVTRSELHLEVP